MPGMKGTRAAEGVLFFFAMEFLQFFQYFWIADNLKDEKCKNVINKALTLVGFLHICLQVVPNIFADFQSDVVPSPTTRMSLTPP